MKEEDGSQKSVVDKKDEKVETVESLDIPRKIKSRDTEHLELADMNQTAISRAKKIKYFLGVGFGTVLVTTTLVLVLVLNREDDTEEIQNFENYEEKIPGDAITF